MLTPQQVCYLQTVPFCRWTCCLLDVSSSMQKDTVPLAYFCFCFPCLRRQIQHIIAKINVKEHLLLFSPSGVSDFATPLTAARQASLSITNYQSLLKSISIESMMPSNHLSHPLSPASPPAFNLSPHQGLFQ